MKAAIVLAVCYFALCAEQVSSFECLGPDGSARDWFIIYKIPIFPKRRDIFRFGKGYYYMDNTATRWYQSKTEIDSKTDNALYNTLQQIYKNPAKSYMYAMYSDQPPSMKDASSIYGHMKGVVGFDSSDGFWLVHSTPKFPPKRADGYSWPDSAKINGQTFICVSYNFDMLDEIGKLLMYDYPKFYDDQFPEEFVNLAPVMGKIFKQNSLQITLKSKAGTKFTSFAKTSDFAADLYDSLVAPKLKESLYVQSWHQDLGASCTGSFKVMNISEVGFNKDIFFPDTKDHAKWAVSKTNDYTCIGDINRARSQFKRGGGTVCIKNKKVSVIFRGLMNKKEDCP